MALERSSKIDVCNEKAQIHRDPGHSILMKTQDRNDLENQWKQTSIELEQLIAGSKEIESRLFIRDSKKCIGSTI